MQSRIRVAVDFGNNNQPVIHIANQESDDDVRDALINQFIYGFPNSTSRWCLLKYIGEEQGEPKGTMKHFHIVPIMEGQIMEEIKLMKAYLATITKEGPQEMEWVSIHDNSIAFRQLLDQKGITWKQNEHSTLVDASTDLFTLGKEVQKLKSQS